METQNNTLAKKTILVLLILLLGSFLAYYAYTSTVFSKYHKVMREEYLYFTPDPLSEQLTVAFSLYENGDVPYVDLGEITPFSWERVYVFSPYTSLTTLDDTFGLSWRKSCFTDIENLETYALLVFTERSKVIHCLEYPTNTYRLYSLSQYSSGIFKQNALLILDDNYKVLLLEN